MISTLASKKTLLRTAVGLQNAGKLFPLADVELGDVFKGSIDRFSDIAIRLRDAHKVLNVGAGHGMLVSLLAELGHECHALDVRNQPSAYPDVYRKG